MSAERISKMHLLILAGAFVLLAGCKCPPAVTPPIPPIVFGPIDVIPDRIDRCEWPQDFTVTGDHLAQAKESFYLGPVAAKALGESIKVDTPSGERRRVTFPLPSQPNLNHTVTLAMIAPDGSVRAAQIRIDADKCASPPPTFEVSPRTMSACDSSAAFFVTGEKISEDKTGYLLGSVPASGATALKRDSARLVQVHFDNLDKANRDVSPLTLSIAREDGSLTPVAIEIDGTQESCTKSKGVAPPGSVKAPESAKIVLSAVGGSPADQVEVCQLPVRLAATGSGISKLNDNSVSVLGGKYPGSVERVSAGKTSTVTLVFNKLPNFKEAPLTGDELDVAMTVGGKHVTVKVPVKCSQ